MSINSTNMSKVNFMKESQEPSPDEIINESFLSSVNGSDEIKRRALFTAPVTVDPECKMSNNSINMPNVEFRSLDQIKLFVNMNKTDTALYYYNLVKDTIKIIGKEQDVYYYNEESKLWLCATKEVYEGSLAEYLNEIGKELWKSFKKLSVLLDDQYDDEMGKLRTRVLNVQKDLDSSVYIKVIIERSTGRLQDNTFATILNSNPDYLPIRNGKKISLKTGEIEDRTKTDYFTFESDVDKVDNIDNANKFFEQVMPNKKNREFLRKVLGYIITGNMDARCFFIWYGDGSNGKTVVLNILEALLKCLYHQTSKGIFMKGSQEKVEGPSPDKIALMGVRCGAYAEGETSDDIDINESFLKMVSGKDKVNARALFRAPLTFYPVCKLVLASNYKPDLTGDKSIRQRIRYIFFDSSFVDKPDPTRKNEFKRDDDYVELLKTTYLSEVFSWILKGSIEYYKDKTLTPTDEFMSRTDSFFEQQDSITAFFQHKLIKTKNSKDYVHKADIFKIYQQFCEDNSQRCQRRSTLFKRLEDLRVEISTLKGYAIYRGVKIVNHSTDDEDNESENMFVERQDKATYVRAEEYTTLDNKLARVNDTIECLQDDINSSLEYIKYLESLLSENEQTLNSKVEKQPLEKKAIKDDTLDLLNN